MNIDRFSDNFWKNTKQNLEFRHSAALNLLQTGTVLDVGCGDGFFLEKLKALKFKARGIDFSKEAVSKCLAKDLDVILGDVSSNLDIPNASFDYVILLDVLEHLFDPEKVLSEAKRISKECIIISVPNFNSLPARWQVLCGKVPENNQIKKGHIFWFNYSNLLALLNKTGLKIIKLEVNTFWSDKVIVGFVFRRLAKFFPSIFALSFVIKVKKNN